MRNFSRFFLLWLLVIAPAMAQAADKVALVIGNGAYQNANALPNPPNDAEDMATELKKLGFEVITGINTTQAQMVDKIGQFDEAARNAKVTLFFYAGHGMQVNGLNYLIPIDAKLERPTSLQFETVESSLVLNSMSGTGRTAIVFLDACRNNPLSRSFSRSFGSTRAVNVGQGLAAPAIASGGMIIGFSTAPGEVAADGEGRNSPFTQALLKNIETPGLEIQQLMTRVKADVFDLTQEKQEPWHNSSLRNEVFLVPASAAPAPAAPVAAAAPTQPAQSAVAGDWAAVKDTNNATAIEAFMKKYADDPVYLALADEQLNRIQGNGAIVPPEGDQTEPAGATGVTQGGGFDDFLVQALDVITGSSDAPKPLPPMKLKKPAAAPGKSTAKLGLTRIIGTKFQDLKNVVPDTPPDFEAFAVCRSSNLAESGCAFMGEDFVRAVSNAFAARKIELKGDTDFDLIKVDGSDNVIIATRPMSGDGEITMAMAVVQPDMTVRKAFQMDISRSQFGIDAGVPDTRFRLTGALLEGDDLYVTLDSDFRCKNNAPISRASGIAIKAKLDSLAVQWVSPFNSSNVNFVKLGSTLYTATVGSCAASFIYALDADSGAVQSRFKLPNGADKLMAAKGTLFVSHYPNASAYELP